MTSGEDLFRTETPGDDGGRRERKKRKNFFHRVK